MSEERADLRAISHLRERARDLADLIRAEEGEVDLQQRILNTRRAKLADMKRNLELIQARLGEPRETRG